MSSIDAVIQALKDYTGTLIFVSHDLHFIRALCKRTIRIEAGRVTNYAGDYDYYLWKSDSNDAKTGLVEGLSDKRPDRKIVSKAKDNSLNPKERRRLRAQEQDRIKAKRGKQEDKVRKLEKEIARLEEGAKSNQSSIGRPTFLRRPRKGKRAKY